MRIEYLTFSALILTAPFAAAQSLPDPKLCESLKAAIAAAPPLDKGWSNPPNVSLAYEGGVVPCFNSAGSARTLCNLTSTQTMPPDQCKISPTGAAEMKAYRSVKSYVEQRLGPTLKSCFPDAKATPFQTKDGNTTRTGVDFIMGGSPSGTPSLRVVDEIALIGDGTTSKCVMHSIRLQINARR
jgi:hypothetical protein